MQSQTSRNITNKMPTSKTPLAALVAATAILTARAAPSPDRYQLVNSYTGADFFTGWSFWDQPDPTNGFVNYTNQTVASASGLAGFIYNNATGEETAYLGVDSQTMNPAAGRASVRISSEQTWNAGGLFVADVRHTPQGICGTWPALWLVGPDWPNQGEIDIIEGVDDAQYNSMTLHTGPGCSSSLAQGKQFLGKQITTNCDVSSSGSNTGCSIQSNASQTFSAQGKKMVTHPTAGEAFNAAGGGVYATLWDSSGVTIWMFPHSAVPSDLQAGAPNPADWTTITPVARFGGQGCDYGSTFRNQQLVIDTTFCGDWAGKDEVWFASTTCAAKAPTCQDFVAGNPAAFKDAYWEIASIKVFQTGSQMAASGTTALPAANGKRAEFPATLDDILPHGQTMTQGSDDAECAHMVGAALNNTNATRTPSPDARGITAPSASANASLSGYRNSTNLTALHDKMRGAGGRSARLYG